MFDLKFTKFFPVKSPMGIQQKDSEKNQPYQSIGVDIYMPDVTIEFIDELAKANSKKYVIDDLIENHKTGEIETFTLLEPDDESQAISRMIAAQYADGIFYIFNNIQIPLGISILIPEGYYIDLRSKSSNFGNDYTSVTGLIDENYTYGFGLQILLIDDVNVELKPEQKISQIVLKKSYKIGELQEVSLEDWEELEDVKERRLSRKGGFGHSGKFDK